MHYNDNKVTSIKYYHRWCLCLNMTFFVINIMVNLTEMST